MNWTQEELAARLKAAAADDSNDAVLKIGRPTGTPIKTTILFDPKRLAEQLQKAGEEETEDFPLLGRPQGKVQQRFELDPYETSYKHLRYKPEHLPEGLELYLHWPDIDDDDLENPESDQNVLKRMVGAVLVPHVDFMWSESGRPPLAGNHHDWVLFRELREETYAEIRGIARNLHQLITKSVALKFELELSLVGLKLLAIAEAELKEPRLYTEMPLIGCISDNDATEVTYDQGEGLFVFQVPDLYSKKTHIIVLTARGRKMEHVVIPSLPNNARERNLDREESHSFS
jgi:hypothetical protein